MNKSHIHTIEIGGKKYEVNLEKAAQDGYLREIPKYPLNTGDVYVREEWKNVSALLIKPFWGKDEYILVGYSGLSPYSNGEYQKILSRNEVVEIFDTKGYKFSHNINEKVRELMKNPPKGN